MGRGASFTPRQDEWILELAAEGMANAEIGATVGRTADAVKGRLSYLGVDRDALAAQDARIRELFEAGLPYEAIAAEVGATKGRVRHRCRSMGLKRTLEDGAAMRGAAEAWREGRRKPAANRAWHVQGDGPLARRFNEQQDELWANGGPKPVRLKNGYYKEACFEF